MSPRCEWAARKTCKVSMRCSFDGTTRSMRFWRSWRRISELTKANPEPSFLDTYAWVLFQQGQEATDKNKKEEKYGLSKKIMDSCFEHGGNSAVMHEHYGDILLELNDINAAKKQWEEAFKKDPGNKNLEKKINNH